MPIDVCVGLVEFIRGLELAAIGGIELPGICRAGIFISAADGQVTLTGRNDQGAFHYECPARIDVPGCIFVEQASALRAAESLRKALRKDDQIAAKIRIKNAGDTGSLQLLVADIGHRIGSLVVPRGLPGVPPTADNEVEVVDGASLRTAIQACSSVVERAYADRPSEYLGFSIQDGWLHVTASNRPATHAVEATLAATGSTPTQRLPAVHHRFLRILEKALTTGSIKLGTVMDASAEMLVVQSKSWSAWTRATAELPPRYTFKDHGGHVAVTTNRTALQRAAAEARALANANSTSSLDQILALRVRDGRLHLQPPAGSGITFTSPPLECTILPVGHLEIYVWIDGLLRALSPFRDRTITLYAPASADQSSPIHVLPGGFSVGDNPPIAAAFMSTTLPFDTTTTGVDP